MNRLLILSALCVLAIATSCKQNRIKGDGVEKTETRTVGGFTAIELSAPLNATITVDSTAPASVQLKGDGNVLAKITTEIKGNTLVIDKEGIFNFDLDKDIIAIITVPSINALTISGAADADVKGAIVGPEFNLKVSGAGDVKIENIVTTNFTSSLSGAGSLDVKHGNVSYTSFKVTGAGDIDAFSLICKDVKAVVSGAGDINLSASEKLDVHISGAGTVKYKGTPVVSSDINGVGSLESVK